MAVSDPDRDPKEAEGLVLSAAVTDPHRASTNAASMDSEQFNNNFGCDFSQIFSPLEIRKRADEARTDIPSMREIGINSSEWGSFANRTFPDGEGGVVPYAEDLDPYFFNGYGTSSSSNTRPPIIDNADANAVVNKSDDDPEDPDYSVRKNTNISEVRTVGLRGPLLLTGWGYDVAGKPVPSKEPQGEDSFKFSDELGNDRAKWKTGPVDLLWDDERQVWAGGLPMLMGVATTDIEAPIDPTTPTTFMMHILRKGDNNAEPPFTTMPGDNVEEVELSNFDPSLSQKIITRNREGEHDWEDNPSLVWVLAIKMNYTWIPFYVGCPPECKEPADCVNLYKDDPIYAGQPGVDKAKNWECDNGECVFSGGEEEEGGSGGQPSV